MKCSDVSTRLVDFLYEEMPAAERRELLAHVDGCASCSAEVKAVASTLGHARAALRGPLDEEPPPHLRARILQAAEAATTAKVVETSRVGSPPALRDGQPTLPALRASRAPSPAAYHRGRDGEAERSERGGGGGWGAEGRSEPSQGSHLNEGFFSRLWKTPWLVPALGAAGVATVVLLVRVIKNPQVLPEERPAATEMLAQPAAEPRQQQRPEAEREPAFPSPSAPAPAQRRTAESDDNSYAERKHAAGKPRAAASAPSGTAGRKLSDEPLGGAGETLGLAPVGAATTAKGGFRAAAPNKAPAAATSNREPAPATRVAKDEAFLDRAQKSMADRRSHAVGAGAGSSARWAEPPPPRPAEAPVAAAPLPRAAEAAPVAFAAAPAPAEPAPAKKATRIPALENQLEYASQEPARSSERAKAQAPVPAPPASPAAQAEAPAGKKKVSQNKDSISLEERVRKAEKLFAEKKWAEAAAAFRALIAQAPFNPAVKTWRERVAAAEGAQEQGRAAKARKAVSGDPLDGL